MPNSIKDNSELLQRLDAEGKIVPALPAPPVSPTAFPIPALEPGLNPLLRAGGNLPASLVLHTDTARQWHHTSIPQTRILPLPPTSNPVAGAQAASQATIIAAAAVANAPSTPTTDVDLITSVNQQSFGGFDTFYSTSANQFVGTLSQTITGSSNAPSEVAISYCCFNNNGTITQSGGSPGAGWTSVAAPIGNFFWKAIPIASSQTVTQSYGGGGTPWSAAGTLVFLISRGTPAFTQLASSGSFTIGPFTPTAGHSLLLVGTTFANDLYSPDAGLSPIPFTASDTAANSWTQIAAPFGTGSSGGFTHATQINIFSAKSVPGVSTTVTITGVTGGTSWAVYDVSNVGVLSPRTYTFATSDANTSVQFGGNAIITATLPTPALAAGWQTLVANNSASILTVKSTANDPQVLRLRD
jgi:hypothetical protein